MSLTVLTWFWSQAGGRTKYEAQHVNVWADMVRRHLKMPHRIACVTDVPGGIDRRHIDIITPPRDFEDVRIPTWGPQRPQCLRRIAMFAPDAGLIFGDRFVCMDLDCVVSGPLDPLFDRDDEFIICPGTVRTRPYNGSMMMLRAGARPGVYTRFTPELAAQAGQQFVGSDQAWITFVLGSGEATWQRHVGYWAAASQPHEESSVTFFPGWEKPWDLIAAGSHGWVEENYRRDPQGRCLILGYASTVWQDADAALKESSFGAVIASPEAAEHWPVSVDAVANDDAHALRLARMMGFEPDNTVFCGKQPERNVA